MGRAELPLGLQASEFGRGEAQQQVHRGEKMGHVDELRSLIEPLVREAPNFPTAGVLFRDLTRLFADPKGLSTVRGKA